MARFKTRLHTVRDARRLSEASVREGKAGNKVKAARLRKDFERVIEAAEDAGHVALMNALMQEHAARVFDNKDALRRAMAVVDNLASA